MQLGQPAKGVDVPELPEVEGLARFLDEHLRGRVITEGHLLSFHALKTYAPPLTDLVGLDVTSVTRHGKFVDIDVQGIHLIMHLARAGWLVWHEKVPAGLPRPGKSGAVLRVVLDDGAGFTVTEAGTQRSVAVYVVNDPADVPGIAALGPDPLSPDFGASDLARILRAAGRSRLKGVLRDQKQLAGIGNAYSDEILHAARLSPFTPADSLDDDAVTALLGHLRQVLGQAIEATVGAPPAKLKDAKRSTMRVHGRAGAPCPVCGGTIAEVSYADSSLQYCPTCQTGGKALADRRLSRLLK